MMGLPPPAEESAKVDAWAKRNKIKKRAEAIRQLALWAIAAEA
jgi:hypothetical protein